jgi:atypical dual specificity phosphatase
MHMAIARFYWVLENALAGCSRPGGLTGHAAALDEDLRWLRGQGIGAVLSLTETPLEDAVLARHELVGLHLPVADLTAPTPQQFLDALRFVDQQRARGRAVAAHCRMGQGRTGTVLAAHLIRSGALPEEAIHAIRTLCPGAIGRPEQERALVAFADRRDWII